MTEKEKTGFPGAFFAGVGVMLVLLGIVYLLMSGPSSPRQTAQQALPLGDQEKAYAERIRFTDAKLSRAANMLNQEVTFLFMVVENTGNRPIRALEISLEFRNLLNEIVLRENRRVIDLRTAPLPGGQSREVQINFENIPGEWNRAVPEMRVTGLLLE